MTDLETVVQELKHRVEDAVQFMFSEFSGDWERAERYFRGEVDTPAEDGRSDAVKTEVRDLIRAIKPSIMRTLLHARKPVQYLPTNVQHGAFLEYQALYINQLFMRTGGYTVLQDAIDEALRLKAGPIKVFWEENPAPKYIKFTGLSAEEVEQLKMAPDMVVESVEDAEIDPNLGEGLGLFDVEVTQYFTNGRLSFEAFPIYEFFVSRNAKRLDQPGFVHGHRREMTVGEAIDLGLECDWESLDTENPESANASGQSTARRGYPVADSNDENSEDPLNKRVLITECYAMYDLKGTGHFQKYCFWLGGTGYTYIDHDEVEDFCIDIVAVDPQPFTVVGRSIPDLTFEMQDLQSFLLRTMVDNAAQNNNARIAADPTTTDFDDLMNNAIGAPIKTRGQPAIQVLDLPFTGDRLLPFMQYLENMSQERVGVTKAAQGLDPDAMQSTDKQAVLNTITLSQGQVELMVRNIVETALIPLFQKALRISTRHMDRVQAMRVKGQVIPIDVSIFDPEMSAEPNVGLGTTSPEQKLQTLMFILGEQQKAMQVMGMDNPFTSLSQIYNTYEDIVDIGGLPDAGRYFKLVTPSVEKAIMEQMAEQAQQAAAAEEENKPMDPSKALLAVETMKSQVNQAKIMADQRIKELELELAALKSAEELDIKRDIMDQERIIKLREIGELRLNAMIEQKQKANDAKQVQSPSSGSAAGVPTVAAE